MGFLHDINLLYVVSGFMVGFLVGLTGVGGGSLMTPILILIFGVQPVAAVGTDLLYACITKTGGSFVHAYHKSVDWTVVGRLALGSIPTTILTILLLHYLDIQSAGANIFIAKMVGVALMLTALSLIFRKPLLDFYNRRVGTPMPELTRNLTIATGALLGFLVSLSSVGAGAIGATALILLYPNLPIVRIVGSDIAHAVPLTLIAGAGHLFLGGVDLAILGSLLLGSLPGIAIASNVAPRAPEHVLRYVLASVLILVSIKLLF